MVYTNSRYFQKLIEEEESLVKYDLISNVRRDPLRDHIEYGIWTWWARPVRKIRIKGNDARKLIDSMNIDFKKQEEELRCRPVKYNVCNILENFLDLYEKNHLTYRADTSLEVRKYLSWLEKLQYFQQVDKKRNFRFTFNMLYDAKVADRDVWGKLFKLIKNTSLVGSELLSINPDRLRYFLSHICSKFGNNNAVMNEFNLNTVIRKGWIDHLRVILDYKSCVEYSSQEIDPIDSYRNISRLNMDFVKENCSPQRLRALIQMIDVMCAYCSSTDASQKENILQAVQLIWKTVPQAYISWEEMDDVKEDFSDYVQGLYWAADGLQAPCICTGTGEANRIRKACEVYKRIFYVPIPQPRSLKNYARIAARKVYSSAEAIDELFYPHELKSYIKLK